MMLYMFLCLHSAVCLAVVVVVAAAANARRKTPHGSRYFGKTSLASPLGEFAARADDEDDDDNDTTAIVSVYSYNASLLHFHMFCAVFAPTAKHRQQARFRCRFKDTRNIIESSLLNQRAFQ